MSQPVDWSERDERDPGRFTWREVIAGIALVMGEHVVVGGLLGGLGMLMGNGSGEGLLPFYVWGFGIGLSQLPYVLPTFVVTFFWRRNVAAGVALGSLLTFLLNGACFGALCATAGNF